MSNNGLSGWKAIVLKVFMKTGWLIVKIIEFVIHIFSSIKKKFYR